MKSFFYNIFVWVSGADTTLLKNCPESEHKKYALQGGLVLIPAVMAFVSMFYATSLLTDDINIRSLLSIGWAVIIFIIDRYIVATFIKKEKEKDWVSIQFFIRIIFAIGLGIVISHPVIIRVFDDKITETQTEIWQKIKDTAEENATKEIDEVNEPLQNRVDKLTKELDTIRKVISAEIVGANTIIGGYYVSNLPGSGYRVAKLANDTVTIGNEMRKLQSDIKININNAIQKRDSTINERKTTLAQGYWGKDDALTIYLDKSKKWSKYWFILIFFVFVDVTAVLLKVFTHYGEYDSRLAERQKYRTEKDKSFKKAELIEKKYLSYRCLLWKKHKINTIVNDNQDNNYEEIKKEFNNVGIIFDIAEEERIDEEKKTKKPRGESLLNGKYGIMIIIGVSLLINLIVLIIAIYCQFSPKLTAVLTLSLQTVANGLAIFPLLKNNNNNAQQNG